MDNSATREKRKTDFQRNRNNRCRIGGREEIVIELSESTRRCWAIMKNMRDRKSRHGGSNTKWASVSKASRDGRRWSYHHLKQEEKEQTNEDWLFRNGNVKGL